MNNPLKTIVESTGKPAYVLLEDELKGIVAGATFYSLLDERGIPAKTQWSTVERVAKALGYEVIFQPEKKKIKAIRAAMVMDHGLMSFSMYCPDCGNESDFIGGTNYRCNDCGLHFTV